MSAGQSRVIKNEKTRQANYPGLQNASSMRSSASSKGRDSRRTNLYSASAFSQGGSRGATGPPPGPSPPPAPGRPCRPPGSPPGGTPPPRDSALSTSALQRPVEHLARSAVADVLAPLDGVREAGWWSAAPAPAPVVSAGEGRPCPAGRNTPPRPGCRGRSAGPPARRAAARGSRTAASRSGWWRPPYFPRSASARPKSVICRLPSGSISMFSGLMSRWTRPGAVGVGQRGERLPQQPEHLVERQRPVALDQLRQARARRSAPSCTRSARTGPPMS